MFNIGDMVVIIDDVDNCLYKIKEIGEKICLIGYSYRVIKYVDASKIKIAPKELLLKEEEISKKCIENIKKASNVRLSRAIFGRILHIDGDIL